EGSAKPLLPHRYFPQLLQMEKRLSMQQESFPELPELKELEEYLSKVSEAIENTQQLDNIAATDRKKRLPLKAVSVEHLLHLLRESDMEALDCFRNISDGLKTNMDGSDYSALMHFITYFEFEEAARLLEHVWKGE
ncbi:MAG: hypothetical protein QM697_15365, partial [Lachnospiraceae bacterium]